MAPAPRLGLAGMIVLVACEAPTPPARLGGVELRLVTTPGAPTPLA